jgi:uncharacterized metal-binding protein
MNNKHINYCLACKTKNCYHRNLGPKTKDCLEINYKDEIKITPSEFALISKANAATKKAFELKVSDNFGVNWLIGFIKNFFGNKITVGIASCLGAVDTARDIIEIFEAEGIKTALVTCKLGGLTIDNIDKSGKSYKHPGCNSIAQAKILNKLDVPVVVLVSLCIGHDMIFIKNCKSYVIPFITKMPTGYGLA